MIGRAMLVRKAERIDVECVVRGYITGSGWKDYQQGGEVCGVKLPPGLKESQELFEPIFTPTTKADAGHDLPITYQQVAELAGERAANAVRLRSLAVYRYGRDYARERGIIIADTKFEFGWLRSEAESASGETTRSSSSTNASRPTPAASGPPTSTRPAPPSPASTSSSSATTSRRSAGTRSHPRPNCRRTSSKARREVPRSVRAPNRPRTGPRMTVLAPEVESFLREPNVAAFATVRPDGRPHVTPVWYEYDGMEFIVSTPRDDTEAPQRQPERASPPSPSTPRPSPIVTSSSRGPPAPAAPSTTSGANASPAAILVRRPAAPTSATAATGTSSRSTSAR